MNDKEIKEAISLALRRSGIPPTVDNVFIVIRCCLQYLRETGITSKELKVRLVAQLKDINNELDN